MTVATPTPLPYCVDEVAAEMSETYACISDGTSATSHASVSTKDDLGYSLLICLVFGALGGLFVTALASIFRR